MHRSVDDRGTNYRVVDEEAGRHAFNDCIIRVSPLHALQYDFLDYRDAERPVGKPHCVMRKEGGDGRPMLDPLLV